MKVDIQLDKLARKHYHAPDEEYVLEKLRDFVDSHRDAQVPRLEKMLNYYEALNTDINEGERRKTDSVSDNRIAHAFAEYITNYIQGYSFGLPIAMNIAGGKEKQLETLIEISEFNDEDSHNSDIGLDLGIYGRAYELLYYNENGDIVIKRLDPLNTFVIYDETIEGISLAAVRYFIDSSEEEHVEVYLNNRILYFYGDDAKELLNPSEVANHSFGSVPVNEFENNKHRQNDFEKVITLIDSYDSTQSDLANYSQDLNDSLLALLGDIQLANNGDDLTKNMKDARILLARPGKTADGREGKIEAKYIYKEYDSTGAEAYKTRLEDDIHKFTHTPNMNDDKVGGVQSGEARKYKMFNLEQKRINKIRSFSRTLRRRWRLILQLLEGVSRSIDVQPHELRFEAKPNLPVDTKSELEAFTKAGGELSQETLIELFPFGVTASEEIARVQKERPQSDSYGGVFDNEEVNENEEK